MVYGVSVEGENVWVATAAGACRLDLHTGQWSLYNERNTPMVEIWVYGVSATPDKVYYAVWGSGVLEYDQKTKVWDKYDDPDGENEMVLFKDQGLIHEIVTSVSYVDNVVWAATYFGDSRYDGRYWHNFLTKDSGLPSNFTNFVKGVDANRAWFCTDKGLAYYDGANWAVYRPSLTTGKPEMTVRDAQGHVTSSARDHRARAQLHPRHRLSRRRHLGRHRQGPEPRNSSTQKNKETHHERNCRNSGDHRPRAHRKARHDQPRRAERSLCLRQAQLVLARHAHRPQRPDHPAHLRHRLDRRRAARAFTSATFARRCGAPSTTSPACSQSEGCTWHDIVRTSCYLRDIDRDYDAFNEERTAFFKEQGLDPLPASTGIQAKLCRPELLVEIEAIAMFRTDKANGNKEQ